MWLCHSPQYKQIVLSQSLTLGSANWLDLASGIWARVSVASSACFHLPLFIPLPLSSEKHVLTSLPVRRWQTWRRPRSSLEIGAVLNGDPFRPADPQLTSRCVSKRNHYCVKTLSLGWLIMQHYFSNNWWIHMASLNHQRKIFPWLQAMVVTMKFGNHKVKELQPPSQCWDSYITKWFPNSARLNEFLTFWYTWKGTNYKPRGWK